MRVKPAQLILKSGEIFDGELDKICHDYIVDEIDVQS